MAEEDEGSIGFPEQKQVAWSMAVIRKKSEWSVFPPINHENLQTPSRLFKQEDEEEEGQNTPSSFSSDLLSPPSSSSITSSSSTSSITSSSSTSSFPPSEVGDEVGGPRREGGVPFDSPGPRGWRGESSGGRLDVGKLRERGRSGHFFPAAAVVLWLLFWRFRLWRWWSRRGRADPRLTRLVEEKDQKIAQLLNQIAQMNEFLISRQRA